MAPDDLLEVGRVDKAHGLRGDVIVSLTTDRTERVAPGARVWIGDDEHEVVRASPHQQRWIVTLAGVEGREAAEALRGATVRAEALDDDGVMWVHDLVGATVVLPDGTEVGTVEAVQDNPAHELLVLADGRLVPVVFVTDAGGLPERVEIDPPPGLLSLDAPE